MAQDAAVMSAALRAFEADRNRRQEELDRRTQEVFRRLPRVAEIDRELRGTVAKIMVSAFDRDTDPEPALRALEQHNLALQRERAELLVGAGYPYDYIDEKVQCQLCQDRGFLRDGSPCRCLMAYYTREQNRRLSKLLDLGGQSFDTFSLDYYSPLPFPGESLTPRENMEFIFDVCSSYARRFGKFYFRNLFLTGAPGLGKTFLSACIARTVSEKGFSVVYDTAVNIFARFEEQKFARDRQEVGEARDETRRYLCCDLLILDDLGSELTTPFVQAALYPLINSRLTADQGTVISSNLTPEDVVRRYTPQISSRLMGEFYILHFFGDDIRLLKRK